MATGKVIIWLLIVTYGTPTGQPITMNESRRWVECWSHFRQLLNDRYMADGWLAKCVPVDGR